MYNVNNQVNFATKTYGYNPTKSAPAKTETEKDAASKGSFYDGFAVSAGNTDESAQTVQLSSAAQNYLKDLKEKYGDYDFIVADYSSDEEAAELLSKGDGSLNVLITPDILEKMATDEDSRSYYEGIITGAQEKITEMTDALGENAKDVDKIGITVGADGKIDYYALMKESFKQEDGTESKLLKDSFVENLAKKVDEITKQRKEKAENTEKQENAIPIPPESFEKYRTEQKKYPAAKDEDYGNIPPESFEKYRKDDDNSYPKEEDYGNLPPESFEKYRKEDKTYPKEEDYGNIPPESFEKYRKNDMNYSV